MTIYLEHFWSQAVGEVETEHWLPPSNDYVLKGETAILE